MQCQGAVSANQGLLGIGQVNVPAPMLRPVAIFRDFGVLAHKDRIADIQGLAVDRHLSEPAIDDPSRRVGHSLAVVKILVMAELDAAAVLHEIPLTTVVFSDAHFGNVRGLQRDHCQGRFIASDLTNPDLVRYAEAFNAQGLRATTQGELRARLREGMAHAGLTLIEVQVGEFNSPWEFVLMPRNRGP